ncbi:MAG: hypothetical protein JXA61_07415 [Bacteroidales bacterium]|nr:hypothetical protein [Bacteroidales bacterium]
MLQRGDYDSLIDRSVKNLVKNPGSEGDAEMLDKAYNLANERDQERVRYLKLEGNPDTWDEIFNLYNRMKNRQTNVRKVLPLNINGRTIEYDFVDYDAEIIAAKRNASEYYYAHGKKLMENNDKESYRQAYEELTKASEYTGGSYLDLDRLIDECRYKGMSRVRISIVNRTIINLPQEFSNELIAVNASELNSQWVEYYTRNFDENLNYDYYVDIILLAINVSPDLVKNTDYIEKKTIEDGFEYVLDDRGNVVKDTAGNDVKIKKYKDIQCAVVEQLQEKDCNIAGEIEFTSANPRTLLKKQPVAAGTHFKHESARAIGDTAALSPEKKILVDTEPVPFPDDIQIIVDCTEALKRSIHDAIRFNRSLLR